MSERDLTAMQAVHVRIPGKLMLAGEYAVLHGSPALACSISLSLELTLQACSPLPDHKRIRIHSDLWNHTRYLDADAINGCAAFNESPLHSEPLLHAIASAARYYELPASHHLEINVRSALVPSYGVGSSSALRLAVCCAFSEYMAFVRNRTPAAETSIDWSSARLAYDLQRQVQKRASGYDVATQFIGGLVCFTNSQESEHQKNTAWPKTVERLPDDSLTALNSLAHPMIGGRGAPTAPILQDTWSWLHEHDLLSELSRRSELLVQAWRDALEALSMLTANSSESIKALIQSVRSHRQLLHDAPHFPEHLAARLQTVPGCDASWTYKTTGAGGEDALLLIGTAANVAPAQAALAELGWRPLPANFESNSTVVNSKAVNSTVVNSKAVSRL